MPLEPRTSGSSTALKTAGVVVPSIGLAIWIARIAWVIYQKKKKKKEVEKRTPGTTLKQQGESRGMVTAGDLEAGAGPQSHELGAERSLESDAAGVSEPAQPSIYPLLPQETSKGKSQNTLKDVLLSTQDHSQCDGMTEDLASAGFTMSSAERNPNSKFVVPPPFDSSSPGDCILQSVEGVQFKALRQILAMGSSVMADMFSLPQPEKSSNGDSGTQDTPNDELPVIKMGEDAETILNLLLLLYPTSMPSPLEVQAAFKLNEAYDKYLIPKDRLLVPVKALYHSKPKLDARPVDLYKLAGKLELKEEAQIASRYTHRVPLRDLCHSLGPSDLEKLLDLRLRREQRLDEIVNVWDPRNAFCEYHGGTRANVWYRQYQALKKKVRESLQDPYPEEKDALELFGQKYGAPRLLEAETGTRQCSCFASFDLLRTSAALKSALMDYPLYT
ncbi:hypothetical protein FRB90_002081 [Tulasnella sp. 427]|nr:hypothetical protein FRB90_002081 [Tulasnella sp. 427]